MSVTFSLFFPPSPTFTERHLPSQQGKVFIVTGGAGGIGYELCVFLYQSGAKVYIAGRSKSNAEAAISQIKSLPCATPGELLFLELHLDDLSTIKKAAEHFQNIESRLDILFNNAGISNSPRSMLSAQGHELQMATNCLGPYLFTQLLLPVLTSTAQKCKPGDVRVVWTSSMVVDAFAREGGFPVSEIVDAPNDPAKCYENSKVGNVLLANELARQVREEGILSVVQNPGNLKTAISRHVPWVKWLFGWLMYHPRMGAYTMLWAGFSEELGIDDGGVSVLPWGRKHPAEREDIRKACLRTEEGGTGLSKVFVEWCEKSSEGFR